MIVVVVLLVFMVLAGTFESLIHPLTVVSSVPLALIGVVPTLLLTGASLNVQSLMGIVMLIGIVVNNAIVLIDYTNKLRQQGLNLNEAVVAAGRQLDQGHASRLDQHSRRRDRDPVSGPPRQALARSSIDDADRFAPELAHEGTWRQEDTWTVLVMSWSLRRKRRETTRASPASVSIMERV